MTTGVEIWGPVNGWREAEKMNELVCTGVMGVPMTSANVPCAKKLRRTRRKERVLERVMKCWLRLLKAEETYPLREALGQKRREKQLNE
jgi:hypothetical protein